MNYEFFFSYTRSNYNPYLKRLFDDLSQGIRDRRGLPKGAVVGFLDQDDVELGSSWSERIRNALSCSRVMVCAYSPAYFKSSYCSREWRAFDDRRRSWAGMAGGLEQDGTPAAILKPVLWMPPSVGANGRATLPADVDPAVAAQQYFDGDPDSVLNREGLHHLLMRNMKREYLDFVDRLAASIVRTADRFAGLSAPPVAELEALQPLFPGVRPMAAPVGHTKEVLFVFVAAPPNVFEGRRDPAAYAVRGGPDWKPFYPNPSRRIGALVQEIAAAEALDYYSDELAFDGNLLNAIKQALADRKLVILVVDPWSVALREDFYLLLRNFDQLNFYNCSVIVPGRQADLRDQAEAAVNARLGQALYFKTRGSATYYRGRVESVEQLRRVLEETLTLLQAEMRNAADVDAARPLDLLIGRPNLSGPGARPTP